MRFADCVTRDIGGGSVRPPMRERVKSAEGCLREIVPLKEPLLEEPHKLLKNFGVAMTALRAVAHDIQRFMQKAYRHAVALPEFPVAGLDVARLSYAEAHRQLLARYDQAIRSVATLFVCNRVGRVEWVDDTSVRFDYIAVANERHLLTTKSHRTRHTHELVKAISHPLSEPNTPMDERTRYLVSIMPASLKPHARIITGLEILQRQEHAGTDEAPTALGQLMNGTSAVAVAAIGLGGAALTWLGSSVVTAVALADPAIAFGEHCLHGWD